MKMRNKMVIVITTILLNLILISCNNGTKIEQLDIIDVKMDENININKNNIIENSKFVHISLDDFIVAFQDITINEEEYDSIFKNETFSFLKSLNEKYGVVISCYSYYENDTKDFNLSECTDKFKEEFTENSGWLKFGFHTLNGEKNYINTSADEAKKDYDKVIKELLRITGSEKSIDSVVRLQNFAGNKESLKAMSETNYGISGVLGADDKRRSYYLDDESNSYLYLYDYYEDSEIEINFFRSDFRIELIEDINRELEIFIEDDEFKDKRDIVIIFTHEWQLDDFIIKENLETFCNFAKENNYIFDYPMNRLNY